MSREHEPLIINLALTGMVPTKEHTPHVPITPEEIVEDVKECRELGVSTVHVHARDEDQAPTHHKEVFAPIIEGIREVDPELVVCATCSGRKVTEVEKRGEVLELEGAAKPDMGSLTLGSYNFRTQASVNTPEVITGLAERMKKFGVKPELEVFEPGMVAYGAFLAERGVLEPEGYVNILLGNPGSAPLTPGSLTAFLELKPEGWLWGLAGIGRYQLDANMFAIAAGGHVRVGVEDNIWWDKERTKHASNADLVRRVRQIADIAERPIATPSWTRERLGLERSPAASPAG
jgi:3-keto-5-aminohexanoate cleavage enzyme